ncbi:sensor histidine kinase [Bacillus sp. V3-13]|uniref:sensor histidine kinase n=1 Tax=Bacillus sp. V3-13 TaxID=2053728 RepID=UPI000C776C6E|nr:sensor histidine kinase [Bacillus sp. V3-13]PLR77308.1 sensor histidine kinase [Bacillus sp. V3-13]
MVTDKQKFQLFPKRFGLLPYVLLIYMSMPIFYVATETGLKMAVGYVLLFLFLVTYRQLYFMSEEPSALWLGLQIGIIVYLSIFYNFNFLYMGFFPANFIAWYSDKKRFVTALSWFSAAILVPFLVHLREMELSGMIYFVPFIVIMLISPLGIRSMNTRVELEKKLDEANEQIAELIKREERMRIARDLHDTLGHTLSLITLKSQLINKLILKDPARARLEAKEVERTSRSALTQVRELVSDMRATTIPEELIEVEMILKAAGISFRIDGEKSLANVPFLTQNILSMCLREAVTNVVKHSKANNCTVTFNHEEGQIALEVQDDGIGLFDKNNYGNGLKGMCERLNLIDGSLNILCSGGTKLVITVPVIVKAQKEDVVS